MTHSKRIALLNKVILAVRPHGHLSESVLEPLQTLRDDLQAESAEPHDESLKSAPSNPHKDAADHAKHTSSTK